MSLAIKKLLCCCTNLRKVSLGLLYYHLLLNGYGLLKLLGTSNLYLQTLENARSPAIDILIGVSLCVIFLITIITIHNGNPSVHMLTASVCIIIVSMVYSFCVMILMYCTVNLQKLWDAAIEEYLAERSDLSDEERIAYQRSMSTWLKPFMFWFTVVIICHCVFELYSALILYSYREDLKKRPANGVLLAQHNPKHEEANVSEPYYPNAQFVNPQYPPQPSQHSGLHPNYPNYPPQYPVPTQNYP